MFFFQKSFEDTGATCEEEKSESLMIGFGFLGGVLLLAGVAMVVAIYITKRRTFVAHTDKTDGSPAHVVFQNTERLAEDLDTAAALQDDIREEYEKLENHARNHIDPKETTYLAKNEVNLRRNRYKDIVPFDSNIVLLTKETG